MPVAYHTPDLLPNLLAVYVCRCGKHQGAYGQHASELPRGWVRSGAGEYVCPFCAARLGASSGKQGRPAR